MKYALYIFVRALFTFRLSEMTDSLWKELQNVEKNFGEKIKIKDWKLNAHPSELIFKYLRLISLSKENEELEKYYKKRMESCLIYYGKIEKIICDFAEMEILNYKDDKLKRNEISKKLCLDMIKFYDQFKSYNIPNDGDKRYVWLRDMITFMYR